MSKAADSNLLYNLDQYSQLKYATIGATSLSVVSTLVVISCFMYIRVHYPEKANRVSLRCVLIACIMKLFDGAIEFSTVIETGDTPYCRAAFILIMFGGVMCATFLAIVGINLVLVFVFHVTANPKKLEWIYYPCGILYCLVTLIVPFISMMRDQEGGKTEYLCYYYINYYQVNGGASPSWMSWYAFVFFTTVIAVFSSALSSFKLLTEHQNVLGNFKNVADSSASTEMSKTQVQVRKEKQTNIFLKVVSRCILYTLVPFVCNICGFVLQLMLVNPKETGIPGFGLALADTIMRCLEGVFIMIIFLSDPVMTDIISKEYTAWKHKFLDEYSQVRKFSDGQVEVIHSQEDSLSEAATEDERRYSISSVHNYNNKATYMVSPHEAIHMNSINSHLDDSNNTYLKKETTNKQSIIMPMRRLTVSPAIFSKLAHLSLPNHLAAGTTRSFDSGASNAAINSAPSNPTWFIDPELNDTVLIPYKHPKIASFIHSLLVRFGFKFTKVGHSTNLPADLEGIILEFSPRTAASTAPAQQQQPLT